MNKKDKQLGMNAGTAAHRLRKEILYSLANKLGMTICYRCQKEIGTAEELSIDHKYDWLDSENPKELFFSLDNVAFSHRSCNSRACRRQKKYSSERERQAAGQSRYRKKKMSCCQNCRNAVHGRHTGNCMKNAFTLSGPHQPPAQHQGQTSVTVA